MFVSVGNAFGSELFGDLSSNLVSIMQSIDKHGDLVKDTLEGQQITQGAEQQAAEAKQQAEEKDIVSAMQAITSALASGHDKLSTVVSSGHDKISSALTSGQEKISSAVTGATGAVNSVAAAVKVGHQNQNKLKS